MREYVTKTKHIVSIGFMLIVMLMSVLTTLTLVHDQARAVNVFDSNKGPLADANSQNIRNTGVIENVINILLFLVGVAAVIAIIIGGIQYVTSNGDASKIKTAKDIILYSVIGLIVALLAWAIVSFVVGRF